MIPPSNIFFFNKVLFFLTLPLNLKDLSYPKHGVLTTGPLGNSPIKYYLEKANMQGKYAMCTGKKTRTESLHDTRGEERGLKAAVLERATNSPVVLMRGERRVVWERQWGDGPGNPPQRCDRRWPCPQLPQPHFALKTFPLTLSRFHQRGLDIRNLNFDQGSDRPRQRTLREATTKLQ